MVRSLFKRRFSASSETSSSLSSCSREASKHPSAVVRAWTRARLLPIEGPRELFAIPARLRWPSTGVVSMTGSCTRPFEETPALSPELEAVGASRSSSIGARGSCNEVVAATGARSLTVGFALDRDTSVKTLSASICRATACRSRLPQMDGALAWVCRLFVLYSTTKLRCGVLIVRQLHIDCGAVNAGPLIA
jgi:hypothetical protein